MNTATKLSICKASKQALVEELAGLHKYIKELKSKCLDITARGYDTEEANRRLNWADTVDNMYEE